MKSVTSCFVLLPRASIKLFLPFFAPISPIEDHKKSCQRTVTEPGVQANLAPFKQKRKARATVKNKKPSKTEKAPQAVERATRQKNKRGRGNRAQKRRGGAAARRRLTHTFPPYRAARTKKDKKGESHTGKSTTIAGKERATSMCAAGCTSHNSRSLSTAEGKSIPSAYLAVARS